jgi:hypothetical protein
MTALRFIRGVCVQCGHDAHEHKTTRDGPVTNTTCQHPGCVCWHGHRR